MVASRTFDLAYLGESFCQTCTFNFHVDLAGSHCTEGLDELHLVVSINNSIHKFAAFLVEERNFRKVKTKQS